MSAAQGSDSALAVVVLAAGKGSRMRSRLHKMLHEIAGRPLLDRVLKAVEPLAPHRTLVVVGHGAEAVIERFRDRGVEFVLQDPQLGTGHALMVTEPRLADFGGDILVLNGDAPLLRSETLDRLIRRHRECGAGMSMLTYRVEDPQGLGRVLRGADNEVVGVIEDRDLASRTTGDPDLNEIVPGFYLFDRRAFEIGARLGNDNAQNEYYITDMPRLYLEAGFRVEALCADDDARQRVGVNTRAELAEAEAILHERIRRSWLAAGVTMRAPATVFIDDGVRLASDVILEPGVILRGDTTIGEGALIGAYSVLEDAHIAPGKQIAPHTVIGPSPGATARSDRFPR